MNFLSSIKAAAANAALRRLATYYKEKGEMVRLQLDSGSKKIEIELQLKGQPEPVRIVARRYELLSSGPRHFIVFRDIETSQQWLNVAMKTFGATEYTFELPEKYAELIELAL